MSENVITQDAQGDAVVHENVSGVELLTESGGTATFIHDAEIKQSDWNQTDSGQKDFIKNKPALARVATAGSYNDLKDRPFGDLVSPMEETELTTAVIPGFGGHCGAADLSLAQIVEGENYEVNWGGTIHTCTAKRTADAVGSTYAGLFGVNTLYLGNAALLMWLGEVTDTVEDTGEPFAVWFRPDEVGVDVIFTEDAAATTRTVSITAVNSVVKIHEKYLPDGIATEDFVEQKIAEIDTSGSSSGSGLPEVTEADDGKFLGVTGGKWAAVAAPAGGSSEVDIFPEQTLGFSMNSTYNLYAAYIEPAPFSLMVGETYIVHWDDGVYSCVATDGSALIPGVVFIGDASGYGLSGSGEPFIIGGDATGGIFLSLTDAAATSHTVRIYQTSTAAVSWNDLTDKPFYEEGGTVEVFAEQTLEFEESEAALPAPFIPTADTVYKVVWDGAEYECTAVVVEDGIVLLGNQAAFGEGVVTDEPFFIMFYPDSITGEGDILIFAALDLSNNMFDTASSHKIAIYRDDTVTKYLDNKYLDFLEHHEAEETDVLAETTIEGFALYDTVFVANATTAGFTGTVDEIYIVVWDGVEYECAMGGDGDKRFLGNMTLGGLDGNTGEPFLMISDGSEISVGTSDTAATSHTIRIFQRTGEEGYTVKEDYLPGMVHYVTVTAAEDGTATTDKTFEEIIALVDADRLVMAKLDAGGEIVHLPLVSSFSGGVLFHLNTFASDTLVMTEFTVVILSNGTAVLTRESKTIAAAETTT